MAEGFRWALVATVAVAADEAVTVGPGVVVFDEQGRSRSPRQPSTLIKEMVE